MGDEIAGQFPYIPYDGGTKFTAIPDQNFLVEAAYFLHRAKVQPFLKYEPQAFAAASNASKHVNRFGAGASYYIKCQSLKWTTQYLRCLPQNGSPLKPSNEFALQLQFRYF